MPNPQNRMGYVRQLFYDAAGSTATQRVENCLDINHNIDVSYGSTKRRGDGTSVPIDYEKATSRKPMVTWSMNNEPNDTILALFRTAARAGGVVALVVKERNAAGSEVTVLDGDFNIKVSDKDPIGGESTFDFEASPSRDYGRDIAFS